MNQQRDDQRGQLKADSSWAHLIPEEQWKVYLEAIRCVRKTGARFMLGGAFGLAGYTGRLRNTKDLDFFVLPSEKDKVVDAINKAGFDDYYPHLAYDRGWIYRAIKNDVIVDTIWQTPNRRSEVDDQWLARSREVTLHGEKLEILPAEEMVAIKLFVLQRDRCDWTDLLNLLYRQAELLDWKHLLDRLGSEEPLLNGLLQVFNWLAPEQARKIPETIRARFHLPVPTSADLAQATQQRVAMLDSRPWFAAFQPADKPMQM